MASIERMRIPLLLSGTIIAVLITFGSVTASCSCSQSYCDQSFAKLDQSYGEYRDSTDLISTTGQQIRSERSEPGEKEWNQDEDGPSRPGYFEGINFKTGHVKDFKEALEKKGFTVQEGKYSYLDFIKYFNEGIIPNIGGNNPSSKYLSFLVPPAPGHEVGSVMANNSTAPGLSGTTSHRWNLRPDEAIVFVGRTPPKCKYFSFDTVLITGTYEDEILWLSAPIGDTLNNLVIKTEGTPNGRHGNPFNQNTVVILTADRGIDRRIRAAAQSAGYPESIINTMVLPSSMLHMGVEDNSDIFYTVIRPALYKDKQAGENYLNNPPAVIFRITPNESTTLHPYKVPELRVRGAGTTELDLMDDLEELRKAILNKYSGLDATELPTTIWCPPANNAFQEGINIFGPDNDACFLWTATQPISTRIPWMDVWPSPSDFIDTYYPFMRDSQVTLGDDTKEFLIVYGVNHAATGKATYSNFVVNGVNGWNGVAAATNLDFSGTAQEYLPNNPNAKYLYVYKVARNCTGDSNCLVVPTGPGSYGIALDQPLFIAWRIYLEKATKTGPSYDEIAYDKAIKFDP